MDTIVYHLYTQSTQLNQILQLTNGITSDHLWHKESFQLVQIKDHHHWHHYQGRTMIADCIADEWLIVSLLFEISKRFGDVIVQ